MAFRLPSLPFERSAFVPYLSPASFESHYGSHHTAVVRGTNDLSAGNPEFADLNLEELILKAAQQRNDKLLFNASQHWNHSLYWLSLSPPDWKRPSAVVRKLVERSFDTFDGLVKALADSAAARIGSGWVWIVRDGDRLAVESTANYDLPLMHGRHALITCDVWEHTYYLDYQNNRRTFVQNFANHLLNWDTLEARFESAHGTLDAGNA